MDELETGSSFQVLRDSGDRPQIDWVVREYAGFEVFDVQDREHPLSKLTDVYEGRRVVTGGMHGPVVGVLAQTPTGWTVVSGDLTGVLAFDEDDRHCWVCTVWWNMRALDRLDISS